MRRVPGREMLARKHRQLFPSPLAARVGRRARGARSIVARTNAMVNIRCTTGTIRVGIRCPRHVNVIVVTPVGCVHATGAGVVAGRVPYNSRTDTLHVVRIAREDAGYLFQRGDDCFAIRLNLIVSSTGESIKFTIRISP